MSPNPGLISSTASGLYNALTAELRLISASSKLQKIKQSLGEDAELYLVGGLIRNLACGKLPEDLDFACNLRPEQIISSLEKAKIPVYSTGLEHGTVTAHIQGENFEITTFRKPSKREDDRGFSEDIYTDLSGRDFTINAIAYSLSDQELVDPYNGISDLINAELRAVESARDRFQEDPLRILRMIRFGQAAGFKVSEETLTAGNSLVSLLKDVSIERIRVELEKILISPYVRQAFETMREVGILEFIFPEILPAIGFEQNEFHTEDVYKHTLSVIEQSAPLLRVRLSALFHDFGKPSTFSVGDDGRRHFYNHERVSKEMAIKIMRRLKFSKGLTKSVANIVALHMRPLRCGLPAVRRLLRDLGDDFQDWLLLKQADLTPLVDRNLFKAEVNNFLKLVLAERQRQLSPIYGKLAINGKDLIALGMKPGRRLGEVLKEIEEYVLEEPERNDKDELVQKAKEILSGVLIFSGKKRLD